MAIVQFNEYIPGKDIGSAMDNVTKNFLGDDKNQIEVNYGVSPADVTIKEGVIIEVNGNRYRIEGSDFTFSMANASHNFITFTDNPSTAFSSSATLGTYSAANQGYYNGTTRTLKFYIDQANESHFVLMEKDNNLVPTVKNFDYIKVKLSSDQTVNGVVQFDTPIYDDLNRWDSVNYRYTVVESGYYFIGQSQYLDNGDATNPTNRMHIRVNGSRIATGLWRKSTSPGFVSVDALYLEKGQYIDFESEPVLGGASINYLDQQEERTFATIARMV